RRGEEAHARWQRQHDAWAAAHPDLGSELARRRRRELPAEWDAKLPTFAVGTSLATRAASGKAINALSATIPELFGGSADLAESNQTYVEGAGDFEAATPAGRNLRFGVREHGMGSILNGLAVSGFRPFGATFLIF